MSVLYFDSSALVKRYLTETGSGWVTTLTDPTVGNTIVSAEITRVEVAAAFAGRQRAPDGITLAERDMLFRLLVQHCLAEYTIVPMSTIIIDRAMHLTQNHRLRGYDAVQLAVALIVNEQYTAAGELYKTVG
jgi:predicted nucleic acid-binding protein